MSADRPPQVPIAIVGISALLPGSPGVDGFWRSVVRGKDLITEVPASHWLVDDYYDADPAAPDKTYGRRGAFLDPVDFDPLAFGIPPNQLSATDTTQLLSLVVADQVLKDATGERLAELDRDRVSVILGTAPLELLATMASRLQRPVWLKALRENGIAEDTAQAVCDRIADHYVPWQEASFPGLLSNVVAGRVANRFDLHGTNCTTDAACASSLAAVSAAVNELALGQADMVITGGVDTLNDITMYMCFSKTPALSPSGDCRPFSDAADGTLLGEGLVMFALKRLSDAECDGNHIYAVLKGIGTSSDGRGTAIYAPLAEGQQRALRRAYESAGYGPDTVELVEAHGTGTIAGDLAEFTALRTVFSAGGRPDSQWCALGSVKSQIGHTKSAAGAVGMLKAVLALHHQVLPPTIKVDRPNPKLDFTGSPMYLNTQARPWIRDPGRPRRASVSSFGFGGSNFHATLEEYVPGDGAGRRAWRTRTAPAELVLLSAATAQELLVRAGQLNSAAPLADLARSSQTDYLSTDGARLAIVAGSPDDLSSKLAQAINAITTNPERTFTTPGGVSYAAGDPATGDVGFLFSGQGGQYVGMGADLAMEFPDARAAWDATARLDLGDRPLHSVVFPPPAFTDDERAAQAATLMATEWAQPALAAQSLAQLALLDAIKLAPQAVAGHSFGELVALHAAGVFGADDLVRLARKRGEAMRDVASVPGAMLAVTGTRAQIEPLLRTVDDVRIANHNAPSQLVVSGSVTAIAAAEQVFAGAGLATRKLDTGAAFHSPLVAPAAAPFSEYLRGVAVDSPRLPVFGNADAGTYADEPDAIRQRMAEHLCAPVQFVDMIESMYAAGVRTFVEVGAGSTLTGLVGAILGDRSHLAVSLDRRGRHGVVAWYEALARLAVHGVTIGFEGLWALTAPPAEAAHNRQPRMLKTISGANYGKPYPPAGGVADLPAPNVPAIEPEPVLETPEPVLETVVVSAGSSAVDSASGASGLLALVLDVVAEKTGYPVDMLSTDMDLESDLGIDSIKRVEILSAVRRSVPGLPELDPAELGKLRSLGEIVNRLGGAQCGDAGPAPDSASGASGLLPLVLDVVAEKTGYPVDMLSTDMDLESDLGIDSIKRVEILSAVRRSVPGLPELDPAELGKLRSLGEIINRLGGAIPATAQEPIAETAPAAATIPDNAGVEVASDHSLTRCVVRTIDVRAPGFALPGLHSGTVVVTEDGQGVAAHVVTRLIAAGIDARKVRSVPADAWGVIHLGGLDRVDSADAAFAVQRDAFGAARTVAERFAQFGGVFVTVQDTGGDFGISGRYPDRAWLAGIAALARTAAREWPIAAVKAIDCERGNRTSAAVAATIVRELLTGGTTPDVGLRANGARAAIAAIPAPSEPSAISTIGPTSVIVVTGGARGVTAETLRALARRYHPKLLLLGRTALTEEPAHLRGAHDEASLKRVLIEHATGSTGKPPLPASVNAEVAAVLAGREVRATVAALVQAGSQVRYAAVDTRDADAVAAALSRARGEWGPITGLIHGAGVVADKRIADKTDEQFDRVFETKAAGLRNLLTATEQDPLDLLCVYSSISAHLGNPGQCDYAMANEVLNQVAHAQRAARPGCHVRSIAWGPWDGGMVNPSLAEHFRRQGVPLISPSDGARAFLAEVTGPAGDIHVVLSAGRVVEAMDGAPATGLAGELRIDATTHPYLADHAIEGTPVVPMALALEWFAGATDAWLPARSARTLRDVSVLRRIGLKNFTDGGDQITVRCDGGELLEIVGRDGARHYRAQTGPTPDRPLDWTVPSDLRPVAPDIYDGRVLFHGPRFQVIDEVTGISEDGAAAVLIGAASAGWSCGSWRTDPAVVDGGLQLAVLWARQVLGGAFLPMKALESRTYRTGLADGPTTCIVRPRGVRTDEVSCDIGFLDSDGSVRAELLGVALVQRPA